MSLNRFLNGGLAWHIDVSTADPSIFLYPGDMIHILPLRTGYVALIVTRGPTIQFEGVGLYTNDAGEKINGFIGQYKAQLSFAGDDLEVYVHIPDAGSSPDGGGTSSGPIGT